MYAIIQSGNRQYRAEAGKYLRVEKLDRKLGEEFEVNDVLFVGGENAQVGSPLVKGALVKVVVTQQTRGPKVLVFKKKRRHGFRRLNGHRQPFTELFVVSISANGATAKADTKPVVVDPAKKAERLAKQQEAWKATPKTERKAKKEAKVAKKVTTKKKVAKKAAAKKTVKKKAVKKKAAKKTKK